jgi:4-hydroxy-3-polyprenylbenzoate decarboxylase
MLKLSRLGVCILPANPGFYHEPATVEDLIDFVVAKIFDQLKIDNNLMKRWGQPHTSVIVERSFLRSRNEL